MSFDVYRPDIPDRSDAVTRLRNRFFRHAPHVVWTSLRGETVVFDIERGKYESLNEVATSVWNRIIVGSTFESILAALEEEYELSDETSSDQMATDVAALISKLEKARVIVSEPFAQVARP